MALRLSVGLGAAVVCAILGPRVAEVARARPGFVPVGMAILLGGLLHARIRHWFIISLCFTAALMAIRDMLRSALLPPALDHPVLHAAYPLIWLGIALTAAAAGFLEAFRPGGAAARRWYFATAFLYLSGHGFTKSLWDPTWESLAILAMGIAAGVAVPFADRLDFRPGRPESPEETEREREERKKARIAAHEWREEA